MTLAATTEAMERQYWPNGNAACNPGSRRRIQSPSPSSAKEGRRCSAICCASSIWFAAMSRNGTLLSANVSDMREMIVWRSCPSRSDTR